MKKRNLIVISVCILAIACQKNHVEKTHQIYPQTAAVSGKWRQMLDTNNIEIIEPAFFSIGDRGYTINQRNNEVYEYNASTNRVTKKNNFPGQRRQSDATAFSIGNMGYYGLGVGQKSLKEGSQTEWIYQYFTDFWEYDPMADTWMQKASPDIPPVVGITSFLGAYGFGIGTKGYIGSGRALNFSVQPFLFIYDQQTGVWTNKTSVADSANYGPHYAAIKIAFAIGGRGYVGDSTTLWEFQPDKAYGWYKVGQTPASIMQPAVSIASKTKGYIYGSVTSLNSLTPSLKNAFYEYVPPTIRDVNGIPKDNGSWKALETFSGAARASAPAFVLNNKVYLGFGSNLDAEVLTDMWEYTPL